MWKVKHFTYFIKHIKQCLTISKDSCYERKFINIYGHNLYQSQDGSLPLGNKNWKSLKTKKAEIIVVKFKFGNARWWV